MTPQLEIRTKLLKKCELQFLQITGKIENTTEEFINALNQTLVQNHFTVTVVGLDGKSQVCCNFSFQFDTILLRKGRFLSIGRFFSAIDSLGIAVQRKND